ncbi:hypothetical protein FGADI_11504 [Fusarium gaditjirri]|uniref:Uncharacterized protein n=1 Tax=Fusarium gaditjirri TaxID=282569 RepID=A0A8H4SUX8_9HYPO|nr:hypothetical protein FGADI_11504 [Fusarium gaditjirri]
MVKSTQEVFDEIKAELGVRRGALSLSTNSSDDYFLFSKHWKSLQQILQAIGEELAAVQETIEKWESREHGRGQEWPRWTRNDERKYRSKIKKLLGSNRRRIKDLRILRTGINQLNEMLVRAQDQVRQDLSLRGAKNVLFLTYVTVVLLPLGFVSSLFSMGQVPRGIVLRSMIMIGGIVERIFRAASLYTLDTMKRSAFLKERQEPERQEQRRESRGWGQ